MALMLSLTHSRRRGLTWRVPLGGWRALVDCVRAPRQLQSLSLGQGREGWEGNEGGWHVPPLDRFVYFARCFLLVLFYFGFFFKVRMPREVGASRDALSPSLCCRRRSAFGCDSDKCLCVRGSRRNWIESVDRGPPLHIFINFLFSS